MAPFPSPTSNWHDNTYPSISPTRLELTTKGKTVVITGGGSGIGAETARSFAQAGASRIALLGRREQPLLDTKASIESNYPQAVVLIAAGDVTRQQDIDTAFAHFASEGKIDILVSNAATIGPQDPVTEVDVDGFISSVQQNLAGSLHVAQAFFRHAAEDAVVVEINSSTAHVNFAPRFAAYSVSKLAVFRMWDSFAFANPNLRVYHVQPGIVNTDMNKEAGGVEAVGFEDHVSLPAQFSVWLASPEASFLKGKYLWANWDVNELKARAKEIEDTSYLSIGLVGWPFGSRGYSSTWDDEKIIGT